MRRISEQAQPQDQRERVLIKGRERDRAASTSRATSQKLHQYDETTEQLGYSSAKKTALTK